MLITINSTNEFNNYIQNNKVICYFTAQWCGPCKSIFN